MDLPSLSRSRRTAGSSLIELLAVLAMLLVMAGIAAPSMRGVIRVSHVDGALERLVSDVAYARTLATRYGRPVRLKLLSAETYDIVVDPNGLNRTVRTVAIRGEYPGVALVPVHTELLFDSRGLLTAGPPEIRAVQNGRTETLTITRTGRAYRAP